MGNIYARLGTFICILFPGVLMALAPLITASIVFFIASAQVIPVFFTVAFLEFGIMTIIVLRQ